MSISNLIIPLIILAIFTYAYIKKVDIFASFVEGAKENIKVAINLLPTLTLLMLTINILRTSGMLDAFTALISPITDRIGFPSECVPLAILRPISGSGAIAILNDILSSHSPDSFAGNVASVIAGATETTLYTLTIYFSATHIRKTRYALASALIGDLAAIILSAIVVRQLIF